MLLHTAAYLIRCVEVNEVVLLANQASCCILKSYTAEAELLLQHKGLTPVGADDDLLIFGDGP